MIDPGHGGHDPGAVGIHAIKEKDAVLGISRALKQALSQYPGYEVHLTRSHDRFLSLRGRLAQARRHRPDGFIAIHADIFMNHHAKGASVYILSSRGASNEASRWLADKENQSELIGGAPLDSENWMVKSVMLSMQQTITQNRSLILAQSVLRSLGSVTSLHARKPGRAAFVVLKSPDILHFSGDGLLSNWREATRLSHQAYQKHCRRDRTRRASLFQSAPTARHLDGLV